ncbi:DNA translocase FtsK [Martelella lutilitoris]|uniref:DNA translocase FtsK n=1 Tax=Martelella lutilitoris TaxID=2583532 RepID=A0A5C4JUL1_9HYPH|nr:DNA translocase FtsK [Martelella lutilitoris]TNB48894.1 DNA translocase FtsK [Martelella lutilitoris]
MPISPYPSLQSKRADLKKADTAEAEADQTAETPRRNRDAAILDPERLPTWQRPFVLGPNVRFTRTPHKKHPEPETPASAGSQQVDFEPYPPSPATVLQERIADELPAERVAVFDSEPCEAMDEPPLRVFEPVDETETEEDAAPSIPWYLSSETNAFLPDVVEADRTTAEKDMTPETPNEMRRTEDDRFSYLPDALAFEMMALSGLEDRPAEKPAQQQEPVVTDPLHEEADAKTGHAEPVAEVPQDELMISSWTATSDAVETLADETKEPAEDVPSPISLYRQVLAYSPTRIAENTTPDAPTFSEDAGEDDEDAEDVPSVEEPTADAAACIDENDFDAGEETDIEAEPEQKERPQALNVLAKHEETDFVFPSIDLLQMPGSDEASEFSQEALEQSAGLLESILEDFGVKGEIIDVRPGPVVTLYEFEPAPGVKSSRVINLSDDIARSMSALSARVAVIPGRNVIGIELPNEERETVYLRELFESRHYMTTDFRLPLCLGKNIGGEPVVAELAKMPHLLVAGTTGSGKSVAINTMILSLLYHLRPEECRLIMVDPKMLELSVYDGIPHLLTPVVTDPKKAVLALKWAVREMEDRYRKMSRLGVRNIDGFNKRVAEARATGETIMVSVPTGFDRTTGEQTFEDQALDLSALPYIVVIVDEMADLMMVAGKEIEGTIQRLAQMARAAGIHLIMATQRPSVDVITGTIKANFPTRISFQVTSRIDSRTILGEQGAEYLLGQGDMLHMKGGGRIARVHGPFVSDYEVEKVVDHLKTQGTPTYLGSVVVDEEEDEEGNEDTPVFDATEMATDGDDADELFAKAIKIVQRDKKCSTSYIQRRLSIGYNRAASLVERMEKEGLVGPANHVGKREILDAGTAG